ncbi:MAG: S8 family peptidase, partial [Fulvivirga sp.]
HATDMATIAAGAGNSFINGRGVAKHVTITSSDFADVLPDSKADYEALNVSVQNHSYGTRIENFYGVQAEAFDQSANDSPYLLHVFSSGNLGLQQDTVGTYSGVEGFANLSGNFKMSKNSLVVGSVDTVGRTIPFVSVGPAYDGRIKPELVTYSTSGSSNSAALVSGVTVLLQQRYLDQNGSLPEASLIKSLLINSANDVYNPGIDFKTGYGNVDAEASLQNLIDQKYFTDSINQGQTNNHTITIPANAQNLKVTIVWNDPAATANSNIALVNDLDLSLSNGTDSWLPWVLDPTPDAALLDQAPIRGEDHLNNVEQISIANPTTGIYTISVKGTDITTGTQSYSIAYDWEVGEQFEWTFPTTTDNMPYDGETGSYFRWRSTLSNSSGTLEYSTDGGSTWQNIAGDVDFSKGHYRWMPPEINSRAIARITAGGTTYETDEFSISRPTRMSVGFNCPDSVMLQWNNIAEATSYDVLTLGDKFLEVAATTSDTSVVLSKSQFSSKYWTIKPKNSSGKSFIQSYTIDYELQGVDCYLISFFPEITRDNKFFLNLEVGTTYGIDEVVFQRFEDGEFIDAYTVEPQSNITSVEETNAFQGPNRHRAIIKFGNGEELISEESFIYYLSDTPFLVFPNPAEPGSEVAVYSKIFEAGTTVVFSLYNREGQKVLEEQLVSNREFFDTSYLEPGLYIYRATAGKEISTGRLVIMGD